MTEPKTDEKIVYAYPPFPMQEFQEDEIDLLDLWRVIWKGKWFIILFVSLCTLASIFISFFVLEKTYESTTTLIPIKQENSSLGNLSGLLGSLPLPISLPGQGTSNIMSFLESRTLKERLIIKQNLLPILYEDIWDLDNKKWLVDEPEDTPTVIKAIQGKKLDDFYLVSQDKKTELITLGWSGKDPQFTAEMTEKIIEELNFYLENEYDSNAKREREFIEKQVERSSSELEHWERQVPGDKLTLSKITRERFAAQTVYTELRKQFELAKIAEAKELETFTILDKPFIPEKPFKPKKLLIVALTLVCSGFIALFLVFFHNFLRNARQQEISTQALS